MSNPDSRRTLSGFAASLLFPACAIFAQSPANPIQAVDEWVQAVALPNPPAIIRIAISGKEWLFIEIKEIENNDCIFLAKFNESELSKIKDHNLHPIKATEKQTQYFIKAISAIKTPLVPKFRYSNDLTELYFASRSMMGSTLLYRGYIRDVPELRTLIRTLFPKPTLPSTFQSDKRILPGA